MKTLKGKSQWGKLTMVGLLVCLMGCSNQLLPNSELSDLPHDVLIEQIKLRHQQLVSPSMVKFSIESNGHIQEGYVARRGKWWKSVYSHGVYLSTSKLKAKLDSRGEGWMLNQMAEPSEATKSIDSEEHIQVDSVINFGTSFAWLPLYQLLDLPEITIDSVYDSPDDEDLLVIEFALIEEPSLEAGSKKILPINRFKKGIVKLSKSRELLIKESSRIGLNDSITQCTASFDHWQKYKGMWSTSPTGFSGILVQPNVNELVFNAKYDLTFAPIAANEFTLEHYGITGVPTRKSQAYFWWMVGIGGGASLILGLWLIYRHRR